MNPFDTNHQTDVLQCLNFPDGLRLSYLPPFRLGTCLNKAPVHTFLREKLLMGPPLDDGTILYHKDLVGMFDSRKPVCYDHHGLLARKFRKCLLDKLFVLRID